MDSIPFSRLSMTRALALILPITLLCVFSVYAHFRVASAGEDYKGALAPFDRVFDLLLTVILVATVFAAGRAMSRLLSLSFTSIAEEAAFSIMLGTGIVGMLVFALGVLGLLRPLPVTLLFVVLLVFGRSEMLRLYNAVREAISQNLIARERRVTALLFCALLVVLALRAGLPPHAVDEAIYHLAAPKAFVDAGRIYPLYDNFSGDMPLLVHMFYAVCLIAKADIAARLFSLALAVTTAIALYAFCARFFTRKMGALAMFGLFGAGMVTEVAITTRVDLAQAGMGFVALYAMMNYLETDTRGWLWASALLSGFNLGIKYTAGIWVGMVGVMFLYESLVRKRERFVIVLARGLLFSAVTLAAFSPWMVKNYVYFKNPVYPFGTGEVAEYGAQGTRFFNADDERKMEAYLAQSKREIPQIFENISALMTEAEGNRVERHPFRVWEFFTDPLRYQMGSAEGHHEPNYLFLLAPLLLILPRHRWVVWLGLISVAFFCFVAATSWIARYYLPVYPAMTLIAVYVLVTLAEKLKTQAPIARILPAAAVVTAVALTAFVFVLQFHVSGGASFLTGSLSRREFLQAAFYYPPVDYINQNSPADAKVMLVGAQMGYHLQRPYLAEVGWDSVEWQRLMIRNDSVEEIYEDIKRQGITHILYGPGLFRFIAAVGREGSGPSGAMYQTGSDTERPAKDYSVQLRNWATFELFRSKYLETLKNFRIEEADYVVLKVK
jgi:4-amino-4-deoxy-L-arabinose transferase-like glycosyltransferase